MLLLVSATSVPSRNSGFTSALALLAALLVVKGMVWALTLPPLDAPDELSHFTYAQKLGLRGLLPYSTVGLIGGKDVGVLYRAMIVDDGLPSVRFYPERTLAGEVGAHEAEARAAPSDSGQGNPVGEYGPVTYSLFALAIRIVSSGGIVAEILAARFVAVLLGMGGALATVWAAREAGLDRRLALTSGALVGLQPMWSQQTAAVSTDAGVLFFSATFLALLLRYQRRREPATALAAALTLAAGLLCKPAMLFAVPFLLLPAWHAVSSPRPWRERMRDVCLTALLFAIALALFLGWTLTHYGVIENGPTVGRYLSYVPTAIGRLPLIASSFWASFGWLEQQLPDYVIIPLNASLAVGALLAVALYLRARPWPRATTLLLVAYIAATAVLLVAFDIRFWRTHALLAIQGRYFLTVFPAMVLLFIGGLVALIGRTRAALLAPFLVSLALLLNLFSLELMWGRLFFA